MEYRSDAIVAVVCGGTSAEAEVSRRSARGVAEALRGSFPRSLVLELDGDIFDQLALNRVDVVFPVLHGPPGEDGTFQGFLETIGIPYVGSGVAASARAMDKIVAKHLFRDAGLPVARDAVVRRGPVRLDVVDELMERLGPEVVVKPARQGSSLGVGFANDPAALEQALEAAFAFDDRVLVEERIVGKEVTVGLIDRFGLVAMPAIEIRTPAGSWYDFEHRYTRGLSDHVIPAEIPEIQYRRVREIARKAHLALGCRDLSRVDFVVPAVGDPVLLEVNTLPGMTPTSLYPDAARASGIEFETLIAHLVQRALDRSPVRQDGISAQALPLHSNGNVTLLYST
jgi:D-alanine-D-alanine ligase